ncbi:hypothetical protein GCM10009663_13770 [Kitasatospora arboriphila]|uniref:Uncharacterized protein n=1 Tax=Kitasatospora arboriphila TaxID=258052 RepID=A0ABN1TC38_9ACTN
MDSRVRTAQRCGREESRDPWRTVPALPIREPSGLLPRRVRPGAGPDAPSGRGHSVVPLSSGCSRLRRGWCAVRKNVRTGVLKAQKDPGATLPGSLTPRE